MIDCHIFYPGKISKCSKKKTCGKLKLKFHDGQEYNESGDLKLYKNLSKLLFISVEWTIAEA